MPPTTSPCQGPPLARKIPRDVSVHGDPRVDDYHWLRNSANPAVLNHLKAENAHTEEQMQSFGTLRDDLAQEMRVRREYECVDTWGTRHGYRYYTRIPAGSQHEIYCRRALTEAAGEEVLLDVNELAQGREYVSVEQFLVSPDGRRVAYAVDWSGEEALEVFVLEFASRQLRPHPIGLVTDLTWGDSETLFYTTINRVGRTDRLWRWSFGTEVGALLYHETDAEFLLSVEASLDGCYVFCTALSSDTSEVRALATDNREGAWVVLQPRRRGHEYYAEHCGGVFCLQTNYQAPCGRLMTVPVSTPGLAYWREILPTDPAVMLTDFIVLQGQAISLGTQQSGAILRVTEVVTGKTRTVTMGGRSGMIELDAPLDASSSEFTFTAESFCQPVTTYVVGLLTLAVRPCPAEAIPGFVPGDYQSVQVWATARDGVRIPISLIHRRDLDRSRPQPLCLMGYGAYGISSWPDFDPDRLSLLDRGVVYAIAHVRGGGELGVAWKEAGRMEHKMTTFTDFIDCAECLVASGWTTPDQLSAEGASAGGLLVGAVINLRPDLFCAVVASMPFVDVLNTMLDASLPLTTEEYGEWGDPRVEAEYRWMRAYSPYDNLTVGVHPAVLVNVSLHDGLVGYWEGAKYIAKLRDCETGAGRHLLRVNLSGGHFGAAGRFDHIAGTARNYAFLLHGMGLGATAFRQALRPAISSPETPDCNLPCPKS